MGYMTASSGISGVTIQTDSGSGTKASDTTGSADFTLLGASGVGVTNSGATVTAVAVPAEIDHDALSNFVASEHLDWTASVGTIHAGNYTNTNTQLSNAQVRTAVEAATDSNVFADADHTKLNGVAASAVAAAGAITAVEGEATLALAGQVNLRAGIEVCTSDPAPAVAESGTVYQFTKGSAGVFTLPANPTVGVQYVLVNTTANDVVITPESGDKINGASANKTNTTAYAATSIICSVGGGSAEWLAFGGI